MDSQSFSNTLRNRHARAQAAEWVLEDHLHTASQRFDLFLVHAGDIDAVKMDSAFTAYKPQQSEAQSGFARAGFTYDSKGFTLFDLD